MRSRSHNGPRGAVSAEGDERAASSLPGRTCIPTDLLRTFVAISEFGSFTKAAHLFGLTQPAVTSQMRRLKSLVGADLLQKSPSGVGVTLTEFGAELLRQARRILSINDQIVSGVGLGPDAETVRIGIATPYAGKLAGVLRECGRAAHPARVQVRCDHSSGLLRGIRAGLLDVVLARGNEEELNGALAQWPEPLVWVRAPDFSMDP